MNNGLSSIFQPIISSNITRPAVRKQSKLIQHVEKDRKSKRVEAEGEKTDPFKFLEAADIDQYAEIGLEMFQKSLTKCSSDSNFNTIIRSIERLGLGRYVDESFPPALKSLVGDNLITRAPWRAFVWLQPDQFSNEYYIMNYKDGKLSVSPDEVRQGLLGDGFLIAVLSSLANKTKRIEKLFPITQEQAEIGQKHGVCSVKLYHAGKPVEVVIDDYYPCISAEQGPAFAKFLGFLWPMMIEKAFAKLFHSYDNIEGSTPYTSFIDLTGAPAKSFYTETEEDTTELWSELLKATEQDLPMTACTYDFEKGIDYIDPDNGFISDHTYSCLGGYNIHGFKLVKLRTVVSEAIWKKKWSIDSETTEWDQIPNKEVYLKELKKQQFVFYIEFSDFIDKFESVQICYMNDDYKYSFNTAKFNRNKGTYFKILIKKPGKYWFTVSQEDERNCPKSLKDDFVYADIALTVGRITEDYKQIEQVSIKPINGDSMNKSKKVEYITANMFHKRDLFCSSPHDLQPGEYIAYTKVSWPTCDENTGTFSVYGPDECKIDEELHFVYDNYFLEKLWLDYAENQSKESKVFFDNIKAPNSYYIAERTLFGYAYIAVWNREQNKKISCQFRVKQLKEFDLKLKAAFSGKDIADFELKPNESRILLIRCKKYKKYGHEDNKKLNYSSLFKVELV